MPARKIHPATIKLSPQATRLMTAHRRLSERHIRTRAVIIGSPSKSGMPARRISGNPPDNPGSPRSHAAGKLLTVWTVTMITHSPVTGIPQKSPSSLTLGSVHSYCAGTLIRSNAHGPTSPAIASAKATPSHILRLSTVNFAIATPLLPVRSVIGQDNDRLLNNLMIITPVCPIITDRRETFAHLFPAYRSQH